MNYRTYRGVVLRRVPYGEFDEIVTFWSWEEGKIRFLVRGIRRTRSRLKAVLTPVAILELWVASSKTLPITVGVQVLKNYSKICSDLKCFAVIFNLFEMILRSTPDRETNTAVSLLLRQSLDYLESARPIDFDFFNAFRLRLLAALGYEFKTSSCYHCGGSLNKTGVLYWSPIFAGLLCQVCSRFDREARKLNLSIIKYLDRLARGKFFPHMGERREIRRAVDQLLSDVLYAVCERSLNSKKFLVCHVKI